MLTCRLWDGLLSGKDRIMVLGSTNRPTDIDAAILRRMPQRFAVGLPNREQRLKILNLVRNTTSDSFTFNNLSPRCSKKQNSRPSSLWNNWLRLLKDFRVPISRNHVARRRWCQ